MMSSRVSAFQGHDTPTAVSQSNTVFTRNELPVKWNMRWFVWLDIIASSSASDGWPTWLMYRFSDRATIELAYSCHVTFSPWLNDRLLQTAVNYLTVVDVTVIMTPQNIVGGFAFVNLCLLLSSMGRIAHFWSACETAKAQHPSLIGWIRDSNENVIDYGCYVKMLLNVCLNHILILFAGCPVDNYVINWCY